MTVRKVVQHPDYEDTSNNYSYDIGLIFLNEVIQSNNIQLPILNVESTVPLVGSTTYALGWGITDTATSALPNDLQIVDLAVLSNSDCIEDYPGYINSDMLCTFNQGKGKKKFYTVVWTLRLLYMETVYLFCAYDMHICACHAHIGTVSLSFFILTSFYSIISQRCMSGRFR